MPIDIMMVGSMHPLLMEQLERKYSLHKLWLAPNQDDFLREYGPRIRGLVTSGNPAMGARTALLERLPALEVISVHGAGYDPVDIVTAKARGIAVYNTPGVPAESVGELALALMLALARRVCAADRFVRAGAWPQQGPYPFGFSLKGKICGIVGLGHSGLSVARMAEALGMAVHYYNRTPKEHVRYVRHNTLSELAKAAHFLVVCVAGGVGTQNLINAQILESLGSKGYLINMARGTVVDEIALITALQEHRIAGAGLDVYRAEPQVPTELYSMEHVVLLPHLGSSTEETRQGMAQLTFDNLQAHFAGSPLPHRVV